MHLVLLISLVTKKCYLYPGKFTTGFTLNSIENISFNFVGLRESLIILSYSTSIISEPVKTIPSLTLSVIPQRPHQYHHLMVRNDIHHYTCRTYICNHYQIPCMMNLDINQTF